jgi:hypothetical protein
MPYRLAISMMVSLERPTAARPLSVNSMGMVSTRAGPVWLTALLWLS